MYVTFYIRSQARILLEMRWRSKPFSGKYTVRRWINLPRPKVLTTTMDGDYPTLHPTHPQCVSKKRFNLYLLSPQGGANRGLLVHKENLDATGRPSIILMMSAPFRHLNRVRLLHVPVVPRSSWRNRSTKLYLFKVVWTGKECII